MRTYNRLRFLILSLSVIVLLSSAKAIQPFALYNMCAIASDSTGSGSAQSHSDDIFQPVTGNYTYSQEKPHAVIGVTNPGGKIPSSTQDIDYNDINKIDEISENKSDFVVGAFYVVGNINGFG